VTASRRGNVPWEGVVVAVAGVLYAGAAFLKPPWHDELFTRWLCARSFMDIVPALKGDSGPPLHYFILHLWGRIAGFEEPSLRLFSVLCILLAGGVFVRILRRISAALPIPALLALFYLFPLNLYYAVEARAYAPLMLLLWIFLDLLFSSRRIWAPALVFALMLYTHNLALLYFPLLLLLPILLKDWKLLGVPILAGAAYLPFLPSLLAQPRESILWMQESFSAGRIMTFLSGMGPLGPPFPMFALNPLGPEGSPTILRAALTVVVACAAAAIVSAGLFHRDKSVRICAIGFVVTGGALMGISAFGVNLYFPSRGEVLVFPFFLVTVLAVLGLFKPIIVRPFAACILLLLIAQAALWLPGLSSQEPLGRIPDRMKPFLRDGDRLYVLGPWRLTLEYYLEREGVHPETLILPRDQQAHPGWYWCRSLSPEEVKWASKASKEGPVFFFSDALNPCDRALRDALPDMEILGSSGPLYFARLSPPGPSR